MESWVRTVTEDSWRRLEYAQLRGISAVNWCALLLTLRTKQNNSAEGKRLAPSIWTRRSELAHCAWGWFSNHYPNLLKQSLARSPKKAYSWNLVPFSSSGCRDENITAILIILIYIAFSLSYLYCNPVLWDCCYQIGPFCKNSVAQSD